MSYSNDPFWYVYICEYIYISVFIYIVIYGYIYRYKPMYHAYAALSQT